MEKEFWKQKSGMKWLKDGDRNTKFFHSYAKGRIKKIYISEITDTQGDPLSTKNEIGDAVAKFFEI